MNLVELAKKYDTDKGVSKHNYVVVYEELFKNRRSQCKNFFEIGANFGESLLMFKDYFENADIWSADIFQGDHFNEDLIKGVKTKLDDNGVRWFDADQGDRLDLNRIVNEAGEFDIILDDASHRAAEQQISLGYLFPYVKSGGLYLIEDLNYRNHKSERFADGCKRTDDMLEGFRDNKVVLSPVMSDYERKYLEDHASSIKFYCDNKVAVIEKS